MPVVVIQDMAVIESRQRGLYFGGGEKKKKKCFSFAGQIPL
jgi:hypothetical protein